MAVEIRVNLATWRWRAGGRFACSGQGLASSGARCRASGAVVLWLGLAFCFGKQFHLTHE